MKLHTKVEVFMGFVGGKRFKVGEKGSVSDNLTFTFRLKNKTFPFILILGGGCSASCLWKSLQPFDFKK
jgi:hypothetical protein